ncbi:hypothetical protein JW979_15180, partial [bacterium]|nr:hypothetical protein [candidate division CSSED10-310 bacterium]
RHDPTPMDIRVSEWLRARNLYDVVIAVKADKLSKTRQQQQRHNIMTALELEASFPIIVCSSRSRLGREEIWYHINTHIEEEISTDTIH